MAATAKPEFEKLGDNVYAALVDGEIIIKIKADYRKDVGKDKTLRVASTLGNKPITGTEGAEGSEVIVGINAYVYRTPK